MNMVVKTVVFVSAALVVLFGMLCLIGLIFGARLVSRTYDLDGEINDISISSGTADITVLPSEDGKCKVVCYERENQMHAVKLQDGTLKIDYKDMRKWYEYIGITFGAPKLTVYLPSGEYNSLVIKEKTGDIQIAKAFRFGNIDVSASTGDVKCFASASELIKIKTSTGDISVKELSAGAMELSVSTGDINVSRVSCAGDLKINVSTGDTGIADTTCKNLTTGGSTGDVSLEKMLVREKLSVTRSTGDVTLDGCDAAEIFIQTDTGDVEGRLLSEKVFTTKTDTGKITVPKTVSGGRCEITTDTGDIRISIKP